MVDKCDFPKEKRFNKETFKFLASFNSEKLKKVKPPVKKKGYRVRSFCSPCGKCGLYIKKKK